MRAKQVSLTARVRTEVGKTAARKLRAAGLVPAVIYGKGVDPLPVSVEAAAFARAVPESAWHSTLINLQVEHPGGDGGNGRSAETRTVIVADVQRNPLRSGPESLLAIDFHQISLQETIRAHVPIVAVGESPGVKLGGVLEYILHEVEVECLPTVLPDHLEADISQMEIGDSFRVRDLKVAPEVKVLEPEDEVLLVVAPPTKPVETVTPPTETGAVVTETPEPEVVRKESREE